MSGIFWSPMACKTTGGVHWSLRTMDPKAQSDALRSNLWRTKEEQEGEWLSSTASQWMIFTILAVAFRHSFTLSPDVIPHTHRKVYAYPRLAVTVPQSQHPQRPRPQRQQAAFYHPVSVSRHPVPWWEWERGTAEAPKGNRATSLGKALVPRLTTSLTSLPSLSTAAAAESILGSPYQLGELRKMVSLSLCLRSQVAWNKDSKSNLRSLWQRDSEMRWKFSREFQAGVSKPHVRWFKLETRPHPIGSGIWILGPQLVICLGRLRRYSFVGGSKSWEMDI